MKLNQTFKITFKVDKGVCNGEIDTFFPCALFAHVCVHYLIRRNKMRSSFDPTDSQAQWDEIIFER